MYYDYESGARNLYTITGPAVSGVFPVRRVGYKSHTGVIFPVQVADYSAHESAFCYTRDGVASNVSQVAATNTL